MSTQQWNDLKNGIFVSTMCTKKSGQAAIGEVLYDQYNKKIFWIIIIQFF